MTLISGYNKRYAVSTASAFLTTHGDGTMVDVSFMCHARRRRLMEDAVLLVQCDFDDTIADGNVSNAILETFCADEGRVVQEEYLAGKYSVEEGNRRRYALCRASEEELLDFIHTTVVVRDGVKEFADYCDNAGIRLVVVSSGLDLYVEPTLQRLGLKHVEAHTAKARITPSGVVLDYFNPSGRLITRGFKEAFLREFKNGGYTVIYVGDGLSDIKPATEADFVIARSRLEQHFKAHGLPYYGFRTFRDVNHHVETIRRSVIE